MTSDYSPRPSLEVPPSDGPHFPTRRKSQDTAPPSYSEQYERGRANVSEQWRSQDPRSSSTQSLRPAESLRDGRRTLLLVYIHGFLGNEMSFQSFPAHVHNLLSILTSETHVLHTKVYPRYKSRKAIEYARDDFSQWLEPNETPLTDVVLLGHSMGGILAAEVALLPPHSPASGQPFRHRIIGTIGFDTPYLGMHPGVIVSGIGSLFRPSPNPREFSPQSQPDSSVYTGPSPQSSQGLASASSLVEPALSPHSSETSSTSLSPTVSYTSTMSAVPTDDPWFDPPFPNDKHLTERTGWSSVLHFINKHSDGLTKATKQYFMSHLEFGGCLADYPGLKRRYAKIRGLEDVDDFVQQEGPDYKPPTRRVRFVNYWTASTGIPKKPQVPSIVDKDVHLKPIETEMKDMSLSNSSSRSVTPTPSISVEEYSDGMGARRDIAEVPVPQPSTFKVQMANLGENSGVHENQSGEPAEMQHIDSMPIGEHERTEIEAGDSAKAESAELLDEGFQIDSQPPLPPIPAAPNEPQPIDLTIYTEKDSRKVAEKEQKRNFKAYQQAVKDRENAIKDRRKLLEKRQKKERQEQDKKLKSEQKQRLTEEKEEEILQRTVNPPPIDHASKAEKPKRDRKFCMLPPDVNGRKDKCWVRVYMEGVDEVGAHCGLFFPGPQYESLVGDVGARVEEWIREDMMRRVILEGKTDELYSHNNVSYT